MTEHQPKTTNDLAAYLGERFPPTWKRVDREALSRDLNHVVDLSVQAFGHINALAGLMERMAVEVGAETEPCMCGCGRDGWSHAYNRALEALSAAEVAVADLSHVVSEGLLLDGS